MIFMYKGDNYVLRIIISVMGKLVHYLSLKLILSYKFIN